MAGARFAESLLKAAQGQKGVIEPTFVDSPLYKDQGVDFFASPVELGPSGVEKIHPVGKISEHEQSLLDVCLKDLKGNIAKAFRHLHSRYFEPSLEHPAAITPAHSAWLQQITTLEGKARAWFYELEMIEKLFVFTESFGFLTPGVESMDYHFSVG
ncbi:MAG: hypothetical protein Q9184_006739 [Pyrenodesmia sp. 2 TL-2023]